MNNLKSTYTILFW